MPGLSADLTDLVIVELHLIKQKCVDLSAIDLSLGIQDLFIRQDVYDLSEHAQTVGLFLHFDGREGRYAQTCRGLYWS